MCINNQPSYFLCEQENNRRNNSIIEGVLVSFLKRYLSVIKSTPNQPKITQIWHLSKLLPSRLSKYETTFSEFLIKCRILEKNIRFLIGPSLLNSRCAFHLKPVLKLERVKVFIFGCSLCIFWCFELLYDSILCLKNSK